MRQFNRHNRDWDTMRGQLMTLTLTARTALALGLRKGESNLRYGIIAGGMAYEIGDKCGSIGPRFSRYHLPNSDPDFST